MTFSEHLDELRKMLMKVMAVVIGFMILAFCFKKEVFGFLLGPCEGTFFTFGIIRRLIGMFGGDSMLYTSTITLITTDISSQFMAHLSVSFYLGLLMASPYILYELMRYVTPALYERERRYAYRILGTVYVLFFAGMAASYCILFPVSCRFLASYSVSPDVSAMITLDSYMSLFISLTFLMGLVFQLPVIALSLAKMGIIDASWMSRYRRHAFLGILVVAAIITPPDILTLMIVALPLYLLYEASIFGVKLMGKGKANKMLKTA